MTTMVSHSHMNELGNEIRVNILKSIDALKEEKEDKAAKALTAAAAAKSRFRPETLEETPIKKDGKMEIAKADSIPPSIKPKVKIETVAESERKPAEETASNGISHEVKLEPPKADIPINSVAKPTNLTQDLPAKVSKPPQKVANSVGLKPVVTPTKLALPSKSASSESVPKMTNPSNNSSSSKILPGKSKEQDSSSSSDEYASSSDSSSSDSDSSDSSDSDSSSDESSDEEVEKKKDEVKKVEKKVSKKDPAKKTPRKKKPIDGAEPKAKRQKTAEQKEIDAQKRLDRTKAKEDRDIKRREKEDKKKMRKAAEAAEGHVTPPPEIKSRSGRAIKMSSKLLELSVAMPQRKRKEPRSEDGGRGDSKEPSSTETSPTKDNASPPKEPDANGQYHSAGPITARWKRRRLEEAETNKEDEVAMDTSTPEEILKRRRRQTTLCHR
eukprot:TRINITY_DN9004_c0_g1_i2.p1 TRINITY_DN9004_c0_g1~~TRINITY_DN9004_c0_g1_i2.p1  ORF type:complete len:441 (+),score=140.62 TRINITY_DN9004_c0_g1_i2:517-1839(+)